MKHVASHKVNGKTFKSYLPIDISKVTEDTLIACHCGQGGCLAELELDAYDTETTSVREWNCPECGETLVNEYT